MNEQDNYSMYYVRHSLMRLLGLDEMEPRTLIQAQGSEERAENIQTVIPFDSHP